jgi:hypothetical protein
MTPKVGDIFWCGPDYDGDDGLYVIIRHGSGRNQFDLGYIHRKSFPVGKGGSMFRNTTLGGADKLFDGELTDEEHVRYAMLMMEMIND